MRHVDDAHHAERDGQTDGDEHQHGSETQTEEQRLDTRIQTSLRVDALDRRGGRRTHRFIALCKRAIVCSCDERREPVPDFGTESSGQRPDRGESRGRIAFVERGHRQCRVDLMAYARIAFLVFALS